MTRRHTAADVAVALALVVVGAGCDKLRATSSPPFEKFVPGDYRPPLPAPVIPTPDGLKKPWRVEMLQTNPRPFKNPRWIQIPIDAAGLVEMPGGSSFECLYNPVKIRAGSDESLKQVAGWHASRQLWCSNDNWRTHTATGLIVHYDAAGTPVSGFDGQAELVLYEVIAGRPTSISILLRAD